MNGRIMTPGLTGLVCLRPSVYREPCVSFETAASQAAVFFWRTLSVRIEGEDRNVGEQKKLPAKTIRGLWYLEPVPKPVISDWHQFGVGIDRCHRLALGRVNRDGVGLPPLTMIFYKPPQTRCPVDRAQVRS